MKVEALKTLKADRDFSFTFSFLKMHSEGKISMDHMVSDDDHEASALYSTSASSPLKSPFSHTFSHTSPTIVDDEFEYWNEADEAFFATADLTTPQSTSPLNPLSPVVLSRWSKQPPSTTSKVAYVLFTTSGNIEDLGVYYNWTACSQSITEGGGKDVCSFRGYLDYELAHNAWQGFQQTGVLPMGVLSPQRPSRGGHTNNFSQHSRSHTPVTPQRPSRGIPSQQGSPALSSRSHTPCMPQPSQRAPGLSANAHDFWVVLSGYEPGVYQTYSSAQHATGDRSNQLPLPANTRQSANQVFVDAYMAHRIDRQGD